MSAREPSDAEIDAAFNDIVARLTETGDDRDEPWAEQRPLHDGSGGGSSRDDERNDRGGRGTHHRAEDLDDEPVLQGEVLDPPQDPQRSDADHAGTDPADADHAGDSGDDSLGWRVHRPPDDDELDEIDLDELPRTPLPPWRPSSVALAALVLVAGSTLVTLLLIFQVRLPWWAGWAALVGFLVGMGLLFTRLPRERDEDSDDGAVV